MTAVLNTQGDYICCVDIYRYIFAAQVDDGKIVDAKFKTFGCGSAIASSSLATEWVKGKHLDEAAGIKNSDIAKVSSHYV